jgi:HTH-type transcriptional regulator / antitoxin HipB
LTLFPTAPRIDFIPYSAYVIVMMIHSLQELAEFAKDHRSRKKLSQAEVGDRVGLRQKTVSAFESKPESTKLDTFFRLLSALDLELQIVPKGDTNPAAQGWDQEW